MSKRLKIVVLMGGVSSERDISLASGENVTSALDKDRYEVYPVEVKDKASWIFSLKEKNPNLVFIGLHGKFGEDGKIQGLLDNLKIPYTGSGALASMLAMDKIITKQIFKAREILSPPYLAINQQQYYFEKQGFVERVFSELRLPLVVKPSASGSSIGVTIIKDRKDIRNAFEAAFKEGDQLLVEEYVSGREITVPVLGNENPKALPVVEIIPKRDFFDLKAKYEPKLCDEIVPARISKELTQKAQDLALKTYQAFGCRGFARIDMIINGSKIYVLEINTIPGLTRNSLVPKSARAMGMEFPRFLDRIIEYALI